MTQGPVTNVSKYINLGPMVVEVGSAKSSLAAAQAATDWRKLGQTESGVLINHEFALLLIKSGFPLRTVKKFITDTKLEISGVMQEFSSANLQRVLGGPDATVALKVSPSTTIASGSTKTVLEVADAADFEVDDEIAVVGGSLTQYGVVSEVNLATDTITLYEGLDGDTVPTVGDAVKRVDTKIIPFGTISSPEDVAIKLSKNLEKGDLEIYIFKANAGGTFSLNFGDGEGNIAPIGLGFNYEAIAHDSVESGALAKAVWSPNG